jgi:hypothetical protein
MIRRKSDFSSDPPEGEPVVDSLGEQRLNLVNRVSVTSSDLLLFRGNPTREGAAKDLIE